MASGYRLYGWRQTGSMAVEAALAEIGIDYEWIPVDTKAKEQRSEEFRRINPRQQLPVLGLPDGTLIAEGPAILNHLADAFPGADLAPPPGSSARAQHDRWLAFFQANVYEGELRKLFAHRYVSEPACAASVQASAVDYVERHYRIYDGVLGDGPFHFGNRLSMLDLYVWMLAQWMDSDWLAAECPKVKRLSDTVKARPAVAPVQARHFG